MAYANSASITIQASKVSTNDQTNFALLFTGYFNELRPVANGGGVQSANGYDIVFAADAAGTTPLNFERVIWNTATGQVEFWVQVPTVSHTVNTTIYILWGDATVTTDQQTASAVWDANYMAVYHANATGTQKDSTTNALNGTSFNTSVVAGEFGAAEALTGSPGSYLQLGTGFSDFTGGITLSIWAFPTAANSAARFFDLGNGQANNNVIFARSGTAADLNFVWFNGSTSTFSTTAAGQIALNVWQLFTVTMTAAKVVTFYKNGVQVATATSTTALPTVVSRAVNYLGKSNFVTDAYYAGNFQEARISNVARPVDLIATEYANQSSPSTFYTVSGLTVPSASASINVSKVNAYAVIGPPPGLAVSKMNAYMVIETPRTPAWGPFTLPVGTVGAGYSLSFGAVGSPTLSYSIVGSLPPGLTLSGSTISGTPTTAGSYSFTIRASNPWAVADLPTSILVNAASAGGGSAVSMFVF